MKFRMDQTLRFWVDCSCEDKRLENANRTRTELIAEILREYERPGDAMRYLNAGGPNSMESVSRRCFATWRIPNVRSRTTWRICHDGFDDCG